MMRIPEEEMALMMQEEEVALLAGAARGQNMAAMVIARIASYAFCLAEQTDQKDKAAGLEEFRAMVVGETDAMIDALKIKHGL